MIPMKTFELIWTESSFVFSESNIAVMNNNAFIKQIRKLVYEYIYAYAWVIVPKKLKLWTGVE